MDDDRKMLRVSKFVADFFSPDNRVVWSSQCSTPMNFQEFWEWSTKECDCGARMVAGLCPNGCDID